MNGNVRSAHTSAGRFVKVDSISTRPPPLPCPVSRLQCTGQRGKWGATIVNLAAEAFIGIACSTGRHGHRLAERCHVPTYTTACTHRGITRKRRQYSSRSNISATHCHCKLDWLPVSARTEFKIANIKVRPHQQQCRSNIVECYRVECCFDNVERVFFWWNFVISTRSKQVDFVEKTKFSFNVRLCQSNIRLVERIVLVVAFDNVASTLLLVWTGFYLPGSVVWLTYMFVTSTPFTLLLVRPITTDVTRSVVCLSVCLSVGKRVSPAKTAEPIEMRFGPWL